MPPPGVVGGVDMLARVDQLRTELNQGPALDVLGTNDLIVSNDLAADPQWPSFGAAAVARLGVRSALAYRLHLVPHPHAALILYSDWPYAFDDVDISTRSIFAAYCSLLVITGHPAG